MIVTKNKEELLKDSSAPPIEGTDELNTQNNENSHGILISINSRDIEQDIREIDERNEINMRRGFNQFLDSGVTPEELQVLRFLFHTAIYQRNFLRGVQTDLSREGILRREEEWLRAQSQNSFNQGSSRSSRRQYQNTNYFPLFLRRDFDLRGNYGVNEPNICFFQGFLCGFLLSIFTIFFLLFCRLNPKFKLGMQIGMVVGVCLFIIPILFQGSPRRK